MVNTLPQVFVSNRNKLTETLPLPVVLAPLAELATNAAAHIPAAREQRHTSRAINRLEPTDDREQFQATRARVELRIVSRQLHIAADRLQHELPMRGRA